MAYSECLPTRLNPLAERTCFSQAVAVAIAEWRAELEARRAAAAKLRHAQTVAALQRLALATLTHKMVVATLLDNSAGRGHQRYIFLAAEWRPSDALLERIGRRMPALAAEPLLRRYNRQDWVWRSLQIRRLHRCELWTDKQLEADGAPSRRR